MKSFFSVSVAVLLLIAFTVINISVAEQKTDKFGGNVITQIGLVVSDIEKSVKAYADLLGVDVPSVMITDTVEKSHANYRGKPTEGRAKLAFFQLDNITIELIEPIGGPSTWSEILETKGEGIHHIAFQVKGMDENIALLENKGGKLVQRGDFTGGSYAYVDLTQQLGIILELLTSTE